MRQFGFVVALIILALTLQGQGKLRGYRVAQTPTPPEYPLGPDTLTRTTDLADVYFLDESEAVPAGTLNHWAKTSPNNRINNYGVGDTVQLFALKNEVISFQTILEGTTSDVDSVSVWVDSLVHQDGLYTIKNDSGRVCKEMHRYAGRPIEHFVAMYYDVGLGTRHVGDTTSFHTDYDLNQIQAYFPDSLRGRGWLPNWLMPATATGGVFYDSLFQGGYPITVKAYKNQSIVTDVYVSRSAAAGEYYGRVRIYEGTGLTWSVPIHLTVKNYALSDTSFMLTNQIVAEPAFTLQRGLTDGASRRTLEDKLYKFFKRHLWGIQSGDDKYAQRANFLQYHMKYYSGTGFSAAAGYDGPGQGVGFPFYFIGPYNMINRASDTNNYYSNVWPDMHDISQWDDSADAWEQGFRDSVGTNYPVRVIYGPDEILRDRTMKPWIEARASTTKGSAGVGSALKWFLTFWMDPQFAGIAEVISVSGHTDNAAGFHSADVATPPYYRVQDWHADGYKVGLYNAYALLPQEPQWYELDAPLSHARAMLWLAKKYNADHIWHWIATYTADWNIAYGGGSGMRDPFKGELIDRDGSVSSDLSYSGSPFTWVWPSIDTLFNYDFGYDGWIGQLRLKALRRGVQDYQYLVHAQRLGVNISAIQDSVVGRAFNNYGDDSPPWPAEYTNDERYHHWKERGWEYERWRRALADSIANRGGP